MQSIVSSSTVSPLLAALLLVTSLSAAPIQLPGKNTPSSTTSGASAEQEWSELIAGNSRFVDGKPTHLEIAKLRKELVAGQNPKAIILSCSDSRVPPEILFDQSLGDLFIVRTAGNVADVIPLASMEYAVAHLKTPLLVIMGHSDCGAVKAACSKEPTDSPNLKQLLSQIAPACSPTSDKTNLTASIKSNVDKSAQDVARNSDVLKRAIGSGQLTVIEAVYDQKTGKVTRIK
jgi:carbonic anhydrase